MAGTYGVVYDCYHDKYVVMVILNITLLIIYSIIFNAHVCMIYYVYTKYTYIMNVGSAQIIISYKGCIGHNI